MMSDTNVQYSRSEAGAAIPKGGSVADYVRLMKPRVMSLVVFTALTGLVAAPGSMHPVLAIAALICIAIGAGAGLSPARWQRQYALVNRD